MAEVINNITSEEDISNYIIVDTSEKLELVLKSFAESKKVAIDTEFVKISTLHPIVALIQLYDGNNVFLIDPICLSTDDMARFWSALNSSNAIFIFFAMHEDLDLINYYSKNIPKNIIDLQLMSAFVGGSIRAGLAATLEKFLGIRILKDQTTSVWLQRPLSKDQIRYAAVDVLHLIDLYDKFSEQLKDTAKETFFLEEMEINKDLSIEQYDEKFGYLKYVSGHMTVKEKAKLRALLNYRLEEAEKQNICLKMIVPNRLLVPMVQKSIRSIVNLEKLGLHWQSIRKYGKRLISLLNQNEYDCSNIVLKDFNIPEEHHELLESITERCNEYSNEHQIDLVAIITAKKCKEMLIYLCSSEEDRTNLPVPIMLQSRWRLQIFLDLLKAHFPEYDFESNLKSCISVKTAVE